MRNLRYFQTVPISQKINKHHLSPFFLPLGFGTFNNWQKVLKKIWIFQMFPSNLCFCTSSFTIFLKFYCFLPPPVFLRFFLTFSVSSGPTPLPPHFSFGQTKRTWGISGRSLTESEREVKMQNPTVWFFWKIFFVEILDIFSIFLKKIVKIVNFRA